MLTGSPRDPARLLDLVPPVLPEGEIVRCESDLVFRVRRDAMYLDPYLFGRYEPVLTGVLSRLVRPGDTVFDIGANFGWFTALLARAVGPTGSVVAFEPVPSIAAITTESVALNGASGIARVEAEGLGSEPGELTLHTFSGLPMGHVSATSLGRPDATPIRCRVTTLDQYIATSGVSHPDFLKVDVDGHEWDVFAGGAQTLGGPNPPVVHFEVAPEWSKGRPPTDLQDLLGGYGYTDYWRIDRDRGTSKLEGAIPDVDGDYLASTPSDRDRLRTAIA